MIPIHYCFKVLCSSPLNVQIECYVHVLSDLTVLNRASLKKIYKRSISTYQFPAVEYAWCMFIRMYWLITSYNDVTWLISGTDINCHFWICCIIFMFHCFHIIIFHIFWQGVGNRTSMGSDKTENLIEVEIGYKK